jgi:hypothetical protein
MILPVCSGINGVEYLGGEVEKGLYVYLICRLFASLAA